MQASCSGSSFQMFMVGMPNIPQAVISLSPFPSLQVWCLCPTVLLPPRQQNTASSHRLWLFGAGSAGRFWCHGGWQPRQAQRLPLSPERVPERTVQQPRAHPHTQLPLVSRPHSQRGGMPESRLQPQNQGGSIQLPLQCLLCGIPATVLCEGSCCPTPSLLLLLLLPPPSKSYLWIVNTVGFWLNFPFSVSPLAAWMAECG